MLDKIIPGIVMALISGVSFLAYKHPKIYRLFVGHLFSLLGVSVVCISLWDLAITVCRIKMSPFVEPSKGLDALSAANALEVPFHWVIICFGCISLYLGFLWSLPLLLEYEEHQKPKIKGKQGDQNKLE